LLPVKEECNEGFSFRDWVNCPYLGFLQKQALVFPDHPSQLREPGSIWQNLESWAWKDYKALVVLTAKIILILFHSYKPALYRPQTRL
jgi:hypothetical protein